MKNIFITISYLITSSCGVNPSNTEVAAPSSLTLQMVEKKTDNKPMAALMLCQDEVCHNTLLAENGGEFYFHNLAHVYNSKVQEEGKGNKVRMALLGITAVAVISSIYFYIRSDTTRVYLKELDEKIRKGLNTDSYLLQKVKKKEKVEIDQELLKKLRKREKYTTPMFYGSEVLLAGSYIAALAPGISENGSWKENKRTIAELFIHGEKVKVTGDEVHSLLEILINHVPATINTAVNKLIVNTMTELPREI